MATAGKRRKPRGDAAKGWAALGDLSRRIMNLAEAVQDYQRSAGFAAVGGERPDVAARVTTFGRVAAVFCTSAGRAAWDAREFGEAAAAHLDLELDGTRSAAAGVPAGGSHDRGN